MKICDSHIHSNNSFDAHDSVEDICLAAIEKGIDTITITDHCETWAINKPDFEFGDFNTRIPKSIKDTEKCAEKYKGKIQVLKGLELGSPCYDKNLVNKALSYGNYDFILAAIHNITGEEDFYYFEFTKENVDEMLTLYFKELLETANFPHFDSLAHLTYPIRYIEEKSDIKYNLNSYMPIIDEIFKTLIKNNKALEINTSGLRKKMNKTMPDKKLIKRFKELGGKYITIGSDAHSKLHVGDHIKDGINLAKECGFNSYVIYKNHEPISIKIK